LLRIANELPITDGYLIHDKKPIGTAKPETHEN